MARLRVLTANLLVDRAHPDAVTAMIGRHRPDIMAVQELGDIGAEAISGVYPHGHLEPRKDGFGLGIAAIKPVAIEPIELPGRSGWVATLEPEVWGLDRPFAIVNIHLINPIDWPWVRSRKERRGQVAGVARYLVDRDVDAVIVGDMNSTPIWPEYRMLAELGIDAAKATGTAHRTWAHFVRGPRWIRIDHAFASGALPLSTETVPVRGSDHRALIVDLEV